MAWQPSAEREKWLLRAEMLAAIRAFFAALGVMEVETPLLASSSITDPALDSFVTHYCGPGLEAETALYLQTSPEFAMKRLLASGSGPIYQICKAFRNGEAGAWHNPEFTLLEWYRPGYDHHQLMREIEVLLRRLLLPRWALGVTEWRPYCEVFDSFLGLDPLSCSVQTLVDCAAKEGIALSEEALGQDRDAWLDLLLSHRIAPQLGTEGLCFLYDYPASQAALARLKPGDASVAERFELYFHGIELANGFHELTHAEEQAQRMAKECADRKAQGKADVPIDQHFLQALRAGLPACAGVALGLDRVLMIAAGASTLAEVLAFPLDRV